MLLAAAMLAVAMTPAGAARTSGVADSDEAYAVCGRVFPDPLAYGPAPVAAPGESPWAKGNFVCRPADFIGYDDAISGLRYLEQRYPRFVQVYDLSKDFAGVLDRASGEGMSAGLPDTTMGRQRVPLYMVRITDERVPDKKKAHFVFPLSIHGIERAGFEGGVRAAEDLATWAAETPGQPVLETDPRSLPAGEVLRRASAYFVLANPDGWRRGDTTEGGLFYQRYNGNGVDLNRDWPTQGYTFRPYTPWSEPETRSFGKVLKSILPRWTGGIDLHGQLIDTAFSFTLLGASQRPFDKNQRIIRFTRAAWADAEERLSWNALIKPNDASPDDPRLYGVQWGTVWDTIDYTVTGGFGDWIDSPLGLGADGIDNEMSLSHLSNCGTGKCFIQQAEQLHVDGNKSLIYAMLNHSLLPLKASFQFRGRAAYLFNPKRLSHKGDPKAKPGPKLPPQPPLSTTMVHAGLSDTTYEFEVMGPSKKFSNGGIAAEATFSNVQGVSPGAVLGIAIDRFRPREGGGDWETVNTDFNQDPIYLQAGMRVDVNDPMPGRYRLRVFGTGAAAVDAVITFTRGQAWPDPGQRPYDVSNMDFFTQLRPFVSPRTKLTKVPVDDVLSGAVDLGQFDTVIAVDDAFVPGYHDKDERLRKVAQGPITGSVILAVGAPEQTPANTAYFEFDAERGNASLDILAEPTVPADLDLYLQKQRPDGSWSDVASAATGSLTEELLSYGFPLEGHYRVLVHAWAGSPGPVDLTMTFFNDKGQPGPRGGGGSGLAPLPKTRYSAADRDRMAGIVKRFAKGGGNLVLTDDSLRALEWMGLVPDQAVRRTAVYAGHVAFSTDDGETSTYDDPLAANVNQPGAAEGDGHRHQVTEPVPIGYAIQNAEGGDFNSMPQWGVDSLAWDKARGRIVGVVGGGDVTLGELPLGKGVVRILGSFLNYPTERYDHPFGLASYSITYTGYELARNLLSWTRRRS